MTAEEKGLKNKLYALRSQLERLQGNLNGCAATISGAELWLDKPLRQFINNLGEESAHLTAITHRPHLLNKKSQEIISTRLDSIQQRFTDLLEAYHAPQSNDMILPISDYRPRYPQEVSNILLDAIKKVGIAADEIDSYFAPLKLYPIQDYQLNSSKNRPSPTVQDPKICSLEEYKKSLHFK